MIDPEKSPEDNARVALEAVLRNSGEPGEGTEIARSHLGIPGWTFFTVTRPLQHPTTHQSSTSRHMVIRDDGTLVQGPPEPEIARMLASLGLPDGDPAVPLDSVAKAILFLGGRPDMFVSKNEAERRVQRLKGADLSGPGLSRKKGSATLTFWAQEDSGADSGHGPPSFALYEVTMGSNGKVTLAVKSFRTRPR